MFVREYLIDLNGTQAAIRAGYSEKTAALIASQNIRKLYIQEAIQAAMDKRADKLDITQERVLEEISKLAYSNMADYTKPAANGMVSVNLSDLTREQWAAVQEIQTEEGPRGEEGATVTKVKFKLADKKGNLELLGRHLKLFNDKLDVTLSSHEKALELLK